MLTAAYEGWLEMSDALIGYEEYVKSLGVYQDRQVPFVVFWVKWFLESGLPDDESFSSLLAASGKKDWQIRQALDAVGLFRSFSGADLLVPADSGEPVEVLVRQLRVRHYSPSTVKTYSIWCRQFLEYCSSHELNSREDSSFIGFLSFLALRRNVAASTQNQAFNAVLFLFRNVWGREPSGIDAVRARTGKRLPVVLDLEETSALLGVVSGVPGLVLKLIYSSGLRLNEALSIRVQDINFPERSLLVRGGKGDKDRVTVLSGRIIPALEEQIRHVRVLFERSSLPVSLPSALDRKYPGAGLEWKWQYLFPAPGPSINPENGDVRRHHLHPGVVQKAMRNAVVASGVSRHATVHTLRHCFATHLLMAGTDLCEIQELLGHRSIETTRVYLHVAVGMNSRARSPLDNLA